MPTYVYRCRGCRHEFEVKQRITEEPLKSCPRCDAPVERVIFGNGVIFKGDGYYTTDYLRPQKTESAKETAEK
ncbi:MAG TPA: zinc ribbon domain-containing protein [Candidatus Mcinerneyibacteriales bacterium]|jgi:putative FmdB family regulatory protein|nr:zinc ribbon domain-containing protein [Candidatus Mcinerneyibacteriales bacterium]